VTGPQGPIEPELRAERPIDPNVRIGHVHLRTADIDRVRDFYVGILGFDVVHDGPKVRAAIGAALQEAALDPFLTGREFGLADIAYVPWIFRGQASFGLDVRVLGELVGDASGLKMCYAAFTKGLTALATELLTAADRLGLAEPLRAELEDSQPVLYDWSQRAIPGMVRKAHRWIAEMEEIAATFAALGLTPKMLEGAAEVYRQVESGLLPGGFGRPDEQVADRR